MPTLPEPISIQDFLDEMEQNLIQDPLSHVGEIGLDYAFRLRNPPSSSSITAKRVNTYSDYKVRLDHQVAVVEAQLRLAMRLKRSASFHTVHASNEVRSYRFISFPLLSFAWFHSFFIISFFFASLVRTTHQSTRCAHR